MTAETNPNQPQGNATYESVIEGIAALGQENTGSPLEQMYAKLTHAQMLKVKIEGYEALQLALNKARYVTFSEEHPDGLKVAAGLAKTKATFKLASDAKGVARSFATYEDGEDFVNANYEAGGAVLDAVARAIVQCWDEYQAHKERAEEELALLLGVNINE